MMTRISLFHSHTRSPPPSLSRSQVLLTAFGRIRVSCCGILDALNPGDMHDPEEQHHMHRMELTAVGQLLLTLACAGLSASPSLDVCAAHHSLELARIIAALLASSEGGQLGSWRQLAAALQDRTLAEMDHLGVFCNSTLDELQKESDNGRLMRLMVKLGFANERPELEGVRGRKGDRFFSCSPWLPHQSSMHGKLAWASSPLPVSISFPIRSSNPVPPTLNPPTLVPPTLSLRLLTFQLLTIVLHRTPSGVRQGTATCSSSSETSSSTRRTRTGPPTLTGGTWSSA
jgi:hypothetical protein